MERKAYFDYVKAVSEFFATEGINNLSADTEAAPDAEFSWCSCDCCRSSLGGNRMNATGYNPTTKEVQEYFVCEDCLYFAEYGRLDDTTMDDLGTDATEAASLYASLDEFTTAYLEAALWLSTTGDDDPLDDTYTIEDFSASALRKATYDCAAFVQAHEADLRLAIGHPKWSADELNGHDLWLTRNYHGAGFWDRDWFANDDVAERLTEAAHSLGETDCVIGDDGLIYLEGGQEIAGPEAPGLDPIYKFFDKLNNPREH